MQSQRSSPYSRDATNISTRPCLGHLQKMKQLCAQYGWTQIEGVSQEEVDKFLLSEDYEKTKEFFEFVKTGGETINLTDLS